MIRHLATITILSAGALMSFACDDDDDGMVTNDASVGAGGSAGARGGSGGGGRSGSAGSVDASVSSGGTSGSTGAGGTAGKAGSGGASGSSGSSGKGGTVGSGGGASADVSVDSGSSDAGPGSVASFDAPSWIDLLDTVNGGEIAQGNLASVNATAAAVKTYGAEMVAAHMEGMANDEATARALGVGRTRTALSSRLEAQSDAVVVQLNSLTGAARDRAYMQAQVMQHQAVLALLDTGISANGGNASSSPPTIDAGRPRTLLALLVATRAVVTEHLAMAQSILASLP